MRVVYSVWDGVVQDNRDKTLQEIGDIPDLQGFDSFNEGNRIRAFFGDRGFFVFDPRLNLVDALYRHMDRAAQETCGKCTPCRMGAPLIRDLLGRVRDGKADAKTWADIEALARQMATTSLCGLGQTSANALLAALDHFRDSLVGSQANGSAAPQYGMTYVSAPCVEACPSKLDVPRYIDYIKDGKPDHSLGVILKKYPMAATCGRVCVRFCEMACRRNLVDEPVGIKTLKRYVADQQKGPRDILFSKDVVGERLPDDMRVAVVGAGPAGVSCAYQLLLKGYHVDVFDSAEEAGGMAGVGIPSYRLPKDVLKTETDIIELLGGHFKFGKKLGSDISVDSLFEDGYKAVFLGLGCPEGTKIGAKGEDPSLKGYASGIDFLLNVHNHVEHDAPLDVNGEVAVIGGGNVAMDCVRSALRLGAKAVHLIYRRTKAEMPADHEEIEAAEREGVIFHYLTNPSSILSKDGKITGMEVVQMRQTAPDKSGRMGVEVIPGSETTFNCDMVIAAIGQQVAQSALNLADGVQMNKWKCIATNPVTLATTRLGVFAGGDAATGPSTLIGAMAQGEIAANSIDAFLKTGQVGFNAVHRMRQILNEHKMLAGECIEVPIAHKYRVHPCEIDPEQCKQTFDEVEQVITAEEAYHEANRCLRCYRVYSVVTDKAIPEGVA